ncbi:MAG: carboxy-S-adenosyl-L-methionine synthase CmoA [Cyanobacteria bacterium J06638_22]
MNSPNSSDFSHPELLLDPTWDALFEQSPYPKPFAFNEEVARVFDNMVSRSIPLYRETIAAAVYWTRAYYQPGTRIIDVGCSTGTFLELLGRFLPEPAILVGVDNAPAMLDKARQKLAALPNQHQVEFVCDRAEAVEFGNSSVVILNYTLQFLPVHHRQHVLNAIHSGLVPGGLVFLSEKVKSPHPRFQEQITRHYEAFKARNGYAQTEVERKKEALENVLVPLTEAQQIAMLQTAGFEPIEILSKFHNFLTLVAEKT